MPRTKQNNPKNLKGELATVLLRGFLRYFRLLDALVWMEILRGSALLTRRLVVFLPSRCVIRLKIASLFPEMSGLEEEEDEERSKA